MGFSCPFGDAGHAIYLHTCIAMKRMGAGGDRGGRDRGAARGHTGPYPLRQPTTVRRPRGRCHPGPFGALDDTFHDLVRAP